MKGILTFHLPLRRGPQTPPEITVLVRRTMRNRWHAGLAMCSRGDQFEKRRGRRVAYHRLLGNPFMADAPIDLVQRLDEHLDALTHRRPYTISVATFQDLYTLVGRLNEMRVE